MGLKDDAEEFRRRERRASDEAAQTARLKAEWHRLRPWATGGMRFRDPTPDERELIDEIVDDFPSHMWGSPGFIFRTYEGEERFGHASPWRMRGLHSPPQTGWRRWARRSAEDDTPPDGLVDPPPSTVRRMAIYEGEVRSFGGPTYNNPNAESSLGWEDHWRFEFLETGQVVFPVGLPLDTRSVRAKIVSLMANGQNLSALQPSTAVPKQRRRGWWEL